MSDLIGGLRQLLQDLAAPDLRAIQAKRDAQFSVSNHQQGAIVSALEAFRAEMRSEVASLRASLQLEVLGRTAPFSEGLTAIELKRGR